MIERSRNLDLTEEERTAIRDALKARVGHDGLVTDFVIVFESIDSDGATWFHYRDTKMAPWRAKGLLGHALDLVSDDPEEEDE